MLTNYTYLHAVSFTASSFVDMYELGEYVYTFLREIPVEINPAVSGDGRLVNGVLCCVV